MQLNNDVKPDDDNSMSELKQLLSEALMKKGIFGKIQAELRASIFSIFKEKELKLTFMSQIQRVNDIKSTVEGKLMFNLILEALDILGLTFSKSVLLSEASLLDVAVSPNALKNQLNLETETEEKNSPVLLQLLNTLNVQDINLEDYIINEKQSKADSFELFKQKQLNLNVDDKASTSKNEETPIIMTSEMKTEKTIDDFKNRNNDILKKLDSIINLDNSQKANEEYTEDVTKNENINFEETFEEDGDELIEEVSLLDIQNNSLISNDEILKESQIIDAEEAARSIHSGEESSNDNNCNNDDNNEETILTDIQKDNKDKKEEDSEVEFISEVSKDATENAGTSEVDHELSSSKEDENSTIVDTQASVIDDPSEIRKQATKNLIDDIKHKLDNETDEKLENNSEHDSEKTEQISIDNINVNSQNIR
ncbi:hypothetical protein LY90DRAFT_701459 [Neocallimastix californiae]|jgi:hypothetical protein|uniref:FGFR1 oncogene partner (FOP) N-terminal dimerisation domain-containing protein n=1 Tax=Neocallimastix californiae TaxID=1754190 RepID=A0A1Y2DIH2_9FUNG|nr:hypothetical protein LY90DRAFT_701459 [Neocallimastix californiae]|eukprot:ORY58946.1 hypothetical protein LY90DRAFT_701459 [Neocallimastix californiae]